MLTAILSGWQQRCEQKLSHLLEHTIQVVLNYVLLFKKCNNLSNREILKPDLIISTASSAV